MLIAMWFLHVSVKNGGKNYTTQIRIRTYKQGSSRIVMYKLIIVNKCVLMIALRSYASMLMMFLQFILLEFL